MAMETLRIHVTKAADWLLSIRNEDGGWGIYEESSSFILSTSEAILALKLTGVDNSKSEVSIQYLQDAAQGKHELKAQYLRHFAWVGYTLLRNGKSTEDASVKICVDWLIKNQNSDGGWSHDLDQPSSTYTTYLAIRTLIEVINRDSDWLDKRTLNQTIYQAILWLVRSQNQDYGWGFLKGEDSNVCATAYGLLAVIDANTCDKLVIPITARTITNSGKFLYDNIEKSREVAFEPNVAGSSKYPFHHFTAPVVLLALLRVGYPIYDLQIWEVFVYLISLQAESGGWAESPQMRPTVWATNNVLILTKALEEIFAPLDHLLLIIDTKISKEKEVISLKKDLTAFEQKREKEIETFRKTIAELETIQRKSEEEKQKLVSMGYKDFQIQITLHLFWVVIVFLIMAYIYFLSAAQTFHPVYKIASVVAIPLLGYILSHIITRQILEWSTQTSVQVGLAVLGVLLALHLAFVGIS